MIQFQSSWCKHFNDTLPGICTTNKKHPKGHDGKLKELVQVKKKLSVNYFETYLLNQLAMNEMR